MKNGYIQKCKYKCECESNKKFFKSPLLYQIFSKNCFKKINNKIVEKKKNLNNEYIYSMTIVPNTDEYTNMQSTSLIDENDNCISCCLHSKSNNHKIIEEFNNQNNKTHSINVKCNDSMNLLQEFGVDFFFFFIKIT